MTDNPGVVFALALDGEGGAQPARTEAIGDVVPAWVHLDYSSRGAQRFLEGEGLEPYVVDTLTRLESRPRTVAVGDGLMIVLRGINRNAGADPEDMVSIRIWAEAKRLFSVRQRPILAANSVRSLLGTGSGPMTIGELLLEIIIRLTDGIAVFVDDIEERMESFEEVVDQEAPGEVRAEIAAIRRQVVSSLPNGTPSIRSIGSRENCWIPSRCSSCVNSQIE